MLQYMAMFYEYLYECHFMNKNILRILAMDELINSI